MLHLEIQAGGAPPFLPSHTTIGPGCLRLVLREAEWSLGFRVAGDGDEGIVELRLLGAHQRRAVRRQAVEDLHRCLSTNRARMRCGIFRESGYPIGRAVAESAIGHVVQHRMERAGMRRSASGADAMPALRPVYRGIGAWDAFWRARAAS
jgi:hypothetical protein